MWQRALLLSTTLSLLLLPPARAELGKGYSLDTFKPYLARKFNTLLGWRGHPVDLKDPKLYRYHANTKIVMMVIEFMTRGSRVQTEIANIKVPYSQLTHEQRTELSWFILNSSSRNVNLKDVEKAFQAIEKCGTNDFFIVSQQSKFDKKKTYYLTVHAGKETFVRLSLLERGTAKGPVGAKDLHHCGQPQVHHGPVKPASKQPHPQPAPAKTPHAKPDGKQPSSKPTPAKPHH